MFFLAQQNMLASEQMSFNGNHHGVASTASAAEREREREMFYLTTHSTHFIYGYMASDIWLRRPF